MESWDSTVIVVTANKIAIATLPSAVETIALL